MSYIFLCAMRRVFRNSKIYCVFAIQIIIAVIIITVISSVSVSLMREYDNINTDSNTSIFYFTADSRSFDTFNMNKYQYISDHFHDVMVCFAYHTTIISDENAYHIYSATDEFFDFVYPSQQNLSLNSNKIIYASDEFINKLAAMHDEFLYQVEFSSLEKVDTNQKIITFKNGDTFHVVPIQDVIDGERSKLFFNDDVYLERKEENTYDIENCIIAPVEFKLRDVMPTILAISFIDGNVNGETLIGITNYLNENADDNQTFWYNSLLQEYTQLMDSYSSLFRTLNFILAFCLIVVFIGFVGIIAILFDRRKRNIAVSIVCGAYQKQIMTEIILEVEFVVVSSILLASIISIILQKTLINFKEFPFYVNYSTLGVITLLSVFISIVIVIIPLTRLYKMNIPLTLSNTN